MIHFLRTLRPLLDRATTRRLMLAGAGTLGLALIEAAGLILVLPLVQLLATTPPTIPSTAHGLAHLLGDPSPLQLAAILAGALFFFFIARGVLAAVFLRWHLGMILHSEASMERRLLSSFLHAPYSFHLRTSSAQLQRAIQETARWIYADVVVAVVVAIADAVLIAVIAVVLLVVSPWLAVGATGYFAVVGLVYAKVVQRRARTAGSALHEQAAHSYLAVQQSLVAIREVKLRHREDFFVDNLYASKRAEAAPTRTVLLLGQLPRYYLEVALILGVALMAFVLYSVESTSRATALLGLFLVAGLRILPSLNRVLVGVGSAKAGRAPLDQLVEDLGLAEGEEERAQPGRPPGFFRSATLELDDVDFTYESRETPALAGISCRVRAGESVAFVGASGAGKSTLLDVMLGLLEPQSGAITIGGFALGDVRGAWQEAIGYVPQNVALLDASVRDNVAFGDRAAASDDDAVWASLRRAELADFVAALPDGLNTLVGESGARLSGGQRQRLGLARALFPSPSVLVLDEATSALDPDTESRVLSTVEALKGSIAQILVTHRLANVRFCDRIYFLERGRIADSGTFDGLVQSNELFARMVFQAGIASAAPYGRTTLRAGEA